VDERASVDLIDALARIWSRIRSHHPDVPGVVLLAAPAANGAPNSLGHFAPLRWKGPKNVGDPVHEVKARNLCECLKGEHGSMVVQAARAAA